MKTNQYLDAAKEKLEITSDYEFAKRMEISKQDASAIRKGIKPIPPHLAYRIAITLELDPAAVIADLELQREKNPKRAEFWRSFLSRAVITAMMVCTLALNGFAGLGSDLAATGGRFRRRLYFA